MMRRPDGFAPPRLTRFGLWLIASRVGGPLLVVLALADLVRWWWS